MTDPNTMPSSQGNAAQQFQPTGAPVQQQTPMPQPMPSTPPQGGGKKPIWKKWWFWVIIVVVALIAIGAGTGGSEDGKKTDAKPSVSVSQSAGPAEKNQAEEQKTEEEKQEAAEEKTLEAEQNATEQKPESADNNVPAEYRNALRQAETYSDMMHLSKQGIYDQLTSEYGGQFPAEAAQYAIDNLKADYNKNALEQAKTYRDTMAMSDAAVKDQLMSEYGGQFTESEAQYAIDHLND